MTRMPGWGMTSSDITLWGEGYCASAEKTERHTVTRCGPLGLRLTVLPAVVVDVGGDRHTCWHWVRSFEMMLAESVLDRYETRLQRCCTPVSAAQYASWGGAGCARYRYRFVTEGRIQLFKGLIEAVHLLSSVLVGLPLLYDGFCKFFGQRPLVPSQFWRHVPPVLDRGHPVCYTHIRCQGILCVTHTFGGDAAHFREEKEMRRDDAVR
jgi:hypothetical protein